MYTDSKEIVECIASEQVFCKLWEETKLWMQHILKGLSIQEAAELAEDYTTKKRLQGEHPGHSLQTSEIIVYGGFQREGNARSVRDTKKTFSRMLKEKSP